jgi:uncharacterized protein YqeY
MRASDKATLNVVRSIRAEVGTAQAAPGFEGEVDDDLYRSIISTYLKRITKAKAEYDTMGEQGAERSASIAFEIEYLERYLPAKLDEQATRALVEQAIVDLGAGPDTPAGQVIGAVMRSGEDLDGALVNRLVNESLNA